MLRQRSPQFSKPQSSSQTSNPIAALSPSAAETEPLLSRPATITVGAPDDVHDENSDDRAEPPLPHDDMDISQFSRKTQWIILALSSGACAAFNGVFAKLTTTELTSGFSTSVAHFFGLDSAEKFVEIVVRAAFFGLNLLFNGIMWALFTKALARGTSTTQVSILNTSANFMITAILGFMIFSEALPPLWFLGAGLLVAGNVIIGRREEKDPAAAAATAIGAAEGGLGIHAEEQAGLMGDEMELDDEEDARRRKRSSEDEDILDIGDDVLLGRRGMND